MNESQAARHLRVIEGITNVLSFVVPTGMLVLASYWYFQHRYGYALFNLGLAAFNVGFTIAMQRRIERHRRRWQAELRLLEQLMREHHDCQEN